MTWFGYTVRLSLADGAVLDDSTMDALFSEVNAENALTSPGHVELKGFTEAADVGAAGETMRGILNRALFNLKHRGYEVTGEGWDAFPDPDYGTFDDEPLLPE